jgi:hypothetical protein
MGRLNTNLRMWKQALNAYDKDLTAADREDLEWFWGYCVDTLGLDRDRCAEAIGMDATVPLRLFRGQYPSLGPVVERIRLLRAKMAGRPGNMIETPVTKRIFEALTYARNTASMVVVRGETGRGKTYAAKEWARRNNHGRTIYVRCPSGCTRAKLVRQVAKALGFGTRGKATAGLEDQVTSHFDGRRTLIVDEAGHLVPTSGRKAKDLLDFLRDLHDICESGVVLIFTSVYWDEIRTGPLAAFFEQFVGRIAYDLHIPEGRILPEEVAAIVAGHEFPESAVPLAAKIAAEEGKLRQLFRDLANARTIAEKAGKEPSLAALQMAREWRHKGGVWK